MITEGQLRQFIEEGAVTIDTPLTEAQINAAAAALDRRLPFTPPRDGQPSHYRLQQTCSYDDPELVEIIEERIVRPSGAAASSATSTSSAATAATTATGSASSAASTTTAASASMASASAATSAPAATTTSASMASSTGTAGGY